MDGEKKSTAKNSLYTTLAFVWPIALTFFTTPFIVSSLGNEQYGIYALIISLVGFFALLDFGVSPSITKYISEAYAKKDLASVNKFYSSAIIFYVLIGTIGATTIILASSVIASNILKVPSDLLATAQIVLLIAGLGFFINMLVSIFAAIPGTIQRFDVTSKINIVISTISLLGTVIIVYLGFGIVGMVAFTVLTSLVTVVVYRAANRTLIPDLKFRLKYDKGTFRKIFSFSIYAFIASVSGVILFQLDRIILGSILGPAAVTFYVIPGNIAIKIHSLVVAASTVIFPLSSELISTNRVDQLRNTYLRASRIIILMLGLIITPLFVLSDKFFLYWMGPEFVDGSSGIFRVLLVTYFIVALSVLPYMVSFGAGKPKINAFFSAITALINIILMYVLIPKFGAIGAAYAYLLSALPTLAFMYYVEKHILKHDGANFYVNLIFKFVILVIISSIIPIISVAYVNSLLSVLLVCAISILISALLFILLRLADVDDMTLIKRVLRIR